MDMMISKWLSNITSIVWVTECRYFIVLCCMVNHNMFVQFYWRQQAFCSKFLSDHSGEKQTVHKTCVWSITAEFTQVSECTFNHQWPKFCWTRNHANLSWLLSFTIFIITYQVLPVCFERLSQRNKMHNFINHAERSITVELCIYT